MYKEILSVVEKDFQAVNQYIVEQLHSDVPLVENIGHYIVEAGGKRLRPILVLLSAKSCGSNLQQHIPLATVIEFIHTATLLHDDVVDMSTLRRGRPTVNSEWNNPSSVLVGDFLYSRAFQILVNIGNMRIMKIIADTTNKIAEAEVLQLINKHNPEASESNYMNVIRNKTAILFQAAAHCGSILANAAAASQESLQHYGMHLGMAFQLIDDALDYDGDSEAMGKNIGDDLTEGKPTLPLIYAIANGSSEQASLIKQCLNTDKLPVNSLQQVIEIVQQTGALDYTRHIAEIESAKALDCLEQLPASEYRDALAALAHLAVNRRN